MKLCVAQTLLSLPLSSGDGAGQTAADASFSPEELEAELDLARGGGGAGDDASCWGNAGGSEDDGVGLVEIGAVQKIEDLRAELKIQLLA
jgi:hypothetical protein